MSKKIKCFFLIIGMFFSAYVLFSIFPQAKKVMTHAYIRTGELLFYLRSHDRAESLFLKAVERLKMEKESSSLLVRDLRRLAWQNIYIDANLLNGEALIKQAIFVSEQNSEELAAVYKDLGEILYKEGKYQESEEALLEGLRIYRSQNNVGQQFDVALKMAIHYCHRSMWEEAEKQVIHAILFRNQKDFESVVSYDEYTEVCILLGKMILYVVKDKNKALEYHLKAYEIAENASLKKQVQVQISLGSYYEGNFQFAEAMEKYRAGLALCTEDGLEVEQNHLNNAMQSCMRKFSIEINENRNRIE